MTGEEFLEHLENERPECYFAERDTLAWNEAWGALVAEFGDPVCQHENGECWQYMGTSHYPSGWKHVFRHRTLPGTGIRTYRHYPASPPIDQPST